MLQRQWDRWREIALFGAVGVTNTIVHGLVLAGAVEFLRLPLLLAHTVAFGVANLFSYVVNSRLTFRMPLSASRYMRFATASLVALALTLGIAMAADYLGFDYTTGFAIVVVTVPVFSFFVIKFWAFAKPKSETISVL
jgi:putative flippase GtrA